MRVLRWVRLLVIAAVLLSGMVVFAADVLQDTLCTIDADEVIEGNLYVLCRELTIDGHVQGSVIGGAFVAHINGTIDKSVYLLAGQLEIAGQVGDDVHFGGITMNILPEAQLDNADVLSAGLSASLHSDAVIPGDVIGFGYQWVANGTVGGDIDFWGTALTIGGTVERNVEAVVGDSRTSGVAGQIENLLFLLPFRIDLVDPGLVVMPSAQINGNLAYYAVSPGLVSGAVQGEATYEELNTEPTLADLVEEEESRVTAFELYLRQFFREFTTLALVGVAVLLLIPQPIQTPLYALRRSPLASLGAGLLVFILSFPLVLLVIIVSLLILFLLALLQLDGLLVVSAIFLGLINLGGAGSFYFVAIFIARVVCCLALGRVIVRRFAVVSTPRAWFMSLAVGVLLLALFASLPGIGWIFNALALFLGLGALLHVLQTEYRTRHDQPQSTITPAYYTPENTLVLPPPVIDETPKPRGMDNLPEGFKWWDE